MILLLGKDAVAEHVIAMIIYLSKRDIEADRAMRRDRNWKRTDYNGRDICGKRLGFIDLGNIGTLVASFCGKTFGMSVLAYDPYIRPEDFSARGAEPCNLEQLLAESDFVSVHVPLTRETNGMLGDTEFRLIKQTAYFITTTRGGVHDEARLASALADGAIAGAGLYVWRPEPPELGPVCLSDH